MPSVYRLAKKPWAGQASPFKIKLEKKNLNHVNHVNLRHLRSISFPATESVRISIFSSFLDMMIINHKEKVGECQK